MKRCLRWTERVVKRMRSCAMCLKEAVSLSKTQMTRQMYTVNGRRVFGSICGEQKLMDEGVRYERRRKKNGKGGETGEGVIE